MEVAIMTIGTIVNRLRTNANMSQEKFAELLGVSRQSVQKWESDTSLPELDKLIKIAKYFDISLDALVFNSDTRITEELKFNKEFKPKYENMMYLPRFPNFQTTKQRKNSVMFCFMSYVRRIQQRDTNMLNPPPWKK